MRESFHIETKEHKELWIFYTHGYINNEGGETISNKFAKAFKDGGRKFLFELADSKIINSIGVSHLIEILEKVLESNGELAFCNCVPIIEKTFEIMGITQYARIYNTAEEAVDAMFERA